MSGLATPSRSGAAVPPWRISGDDVLLRVRLTPKSSRDGFDTIEVGPDGPFIKCRVRAVPENGRANAALELLVAKELGLPKSTVAVIGGHTSRSKTVAIAANASATIASLLARFPQSG